MLSHLHPHTVFSTRHVLKFFRFHFGLSCCWYWRLPLKSFSFSYPRYLPSPSFANRNGLCVPIVSSVRWHLWLAFLILIPEAADSIIGLEICRTVCRLCLALHLFGQMLKQCQKLRWLGGGGKKKSRGPPTTNHVWYITICLLGDHSSKPFYYYYYYY